MRILLLQEFPEMPKQDKWDGKVPVVEWDALLKEALERGKDVPEITWLQPGEDAAWHVRPCNV